MNVRHTMADVLRARGKLGPYTAPVDHPPVDRAAVREWAAAHGIPVNARGPIPAAVVERYREEA